MKIKILFITITLLMFVTTSHASTIIGKWRDVGIESTITIYTTKNGSYYMRQDLKDGDNIVEKLNKSGNKYIKPGSQVYYVIDKKGTLKCYDRHQFAYKADPVQNTEAKPVKTPTKDRYLSAQEAVSIVSSSMERPSNWFLSSKPYKNTKGENGIMICGRNTINTSAVGVWWSSGEKVLTVNGTAKGNTPKLDMTYVVEALEGLRICGN